MELSPISAILENTDAKGITCTVHSKGAETETTQTLCSTDRTSVAVFRRIHSINSVSSHFWNQPDPTGYHHREMYSQNDALTITWICVHGITCCVNSSSIDMFLIKQTTHSASMQLITSLTDCKISDQVRLKWEVSNHRISHYPGEILFISSYDMQGMTQKTVYNIPSSRAWVQGMNKCKDRPQYASNYLSIVMDSYSPIIATCHGDEEWMWPSRQSFHKICAQRRQSRMICIRYQNLSKQRNRYPSWTSDHINGLIINWI